MRKWTKSSKKDRDEVKGLTVLAILWIVGAVLVGILLFSILQPDVEPGTVYRICFDYEVWDDEKMNPLLTCLQEEGARNYSWEELE